MVENFLNLKKETDIQVQEAQRVPNKMNTHRPTPRHIIIKMGKIRVKKSIGYNKCRKALLKGD